ncbi:hypothetical protein D3C75_1219550 [compost metagenome]
MSSGRGIIEHGENYNLKCRVPALDKGEKRGAITEFPPRHYIVRDQYVARMLIEYRNKLCRVHRSANNIKRCIRGKRIFYTD